jgi:Transposase DDE domain
MHIDVVPNRGSRPTFLLRESYREGNRVGKRTLANLSALSDEQIEAMRAVLRGESLRPVGALFDVTGSLPHGHVQAVSMAMQRLGFAQLLSARAQAERDLVCAMVAARILAPHTKLATTRWWSSSTLAAHYGVAGADENALYGAMDWLLARQQGIEKKLAARHLGEGEVALYDLSSSYFEGCCCPLAKLGYSRDGKRGKLQVNYGLLTDRRGCPLAVSVHEGSVSDPQTLLPQVLRLKRDFGIEQVVLVGERGMISQTAVEQLRTHEGLAWITALKSAQIRQLVEAGSIQMGLFDARNLFEITHPDYPDERLVVCRNEARGRLRAHKRDALLAATRAQLDRVRAMVERGALRAAGKIGVRVGKVLNKFKMAKHFELDIGEQHFNFNVNATSVAAEAALDGLYVIRSPLPVREMDSAELVRTYKALSAVERAFRTLKTVNLKIRPIHHRSEDRVRAHIFLCVLAYYVEWHMREAWRELLFADEDQAAKATRDPVAPARRSRAAQRKASIRRLEDGTPAHSFRTLLDELSTIVRNTCRTRGSGETAPNFEIVTTANSKQARALQLLQTIAV